VNNKEVVIKVEKFSKSFGKQKAVDQLSFEVQSGEIFGFLGRNGAGKTTTIRSLLNIMEPDEGLLEVLGSRFNDELMQRIGYLPEERGLYTRATVMDTVMYLGRLRGLSRHEVCIRAKALLERFGLTEHQNKKIQNLSSGMQQKVQIIQAILHRPELLILDEPFRGLDPINRQLVFDTLDELKNEGVTIIFSSHQIQEIEDICDRVIMISNGTSKAYGSVNEIKSQFEPRYIHLNYEGDLPKLKYVEHLRDHGNQAEIRFEKGIKPNQILEQILAADIQIELFQVSRPSLHEIFLELCVEAA
tara:strand:- start:1470 stop:2375 length:906 start_codon:yes stop_codon:yes gene_type:complete